MKWHKLSIVLLCNIFKTIILFAQQDSAFKLCGRGVTWPYYNVITYKGEFCAIKDHFKNNYNFSKFQKTENNSGIVRILFNVNCKGETGNYSIENCDFNYKPCIVNPIIVDELVRLTKELKGWIPYVNARGETRNIHKFFAVKIKKGVIEDILPK